MPTSVAAGTLVQTIPCRASTSDRVAKFFPVTRSIWALSRKQTINRASSPRLSGLIGRIKTTLARKFPSTKFNHGRYTRPVNTRRLFAAFIAAFIFAFLFEWVLHGVILKGSEAALPQGLARAPADFQRHFTWVILGEAIMVFMFTMIYALGFADVGIRAGIGLGIMFGIVYTGANLISYAVQPFPGNLTAW